MTNHDELCEKVLPYGEHHWKEVEIKSVVDACREDLKQALTSGLLCDGKELEEANKNLDAFDEVLKERETQVDRLKKKEKDLYASQCTWIDRSVAQGEEISSLKLKLEVAEKEIEILKDKHVALIEESKISISNLSYALQEEKRLRLKNCNELLNEIESKENIIRALKLIRDKQEEQLSGSCEGMSPERENKIQTLLRHAFSCLQKTPCNCKKRIQKFLQTDEVSLKWVTSIHAQMTGGKK